MGKDFRWFELDKLKAEGVEESFTSNFEDYDGDLKIKVILDFAENTPKEFITRSKFEYDPATKSYVNSKTGLSVSENDCTALENEASAREVLTYIRTLNDEKLYKQYAGVISGYIDHFKQVKNNENRKPKM